VTEVELLLLDDVHAVVLWRDVVIQIYDGPMRAETDFDRAARSALSAFQTARRHAGDDGVVLGLTVASAGSGVPDAESRRTMLEHPKWFDYFVAAVEGNDLRTSVIRLMLSGLGLVARVPASKWEIVSDVATAAATLARRSRGRFVTEELDALVGELRARIRTRGAPV